MRRGTSLVEAIIFGAIASLVVVGIIGLLSKGGKLVELGRRTSSSGSDLKIVIETLTEDTAELVFLGNDGKPYLSTEPGAKLSFVVRSTRAESGLGAPPTGSTGLRKIEYSLEGDGTLKDVIRTVQMLGANNAATGSVSKGVVVKKGVASLKVWPIAAVPQPAGGYLLAMVDIGSGPTKQAGATVACLLMELVAGEAAGDTAIESQTTTKIATKLWCRNRILELSRGALR